ncbi:MAG: hypothetical protein ACR2OG_15790 [Gemmatimonadaceae bacterium]
MSERLERDVRILRLYAVASTMVMIIGATAAFRQSPRHEKFTEIDVERINVMEPDGKYRLVISNRPRSIGPIYKGQPFGYPGGGRPGLIFFNDEGTENGGLTFTGRRGADGKYRASTHMSFDQFNQDQVLNLDYGDNNGQRVIGFSVNDRADVDIHDMVAERDSIMKMRDTVARAAAMRKWAEPGNGVPLVAQRVFVGRDPSRSAMLNLADPNGKPRLQLIVDSLGGARIEFLDATGRVTSTMSDTARRGGR